MKMGATIKDLIDGKCECGNDIFEEAVTNHCDKVIVCKKCGLWYKTEKE